MQAHRVRPWLLSLALLSFAGCGKPPAPEAAAVPPGGPADKTTSGGDLPKLTIVVEGTGANAETHHGIKPGSMVVWNGPKSFFITFQDTTPCTDSSVANHPLSYQAQQTGSGPFSFTCHVADSVPSPKTFPYEIDKVLPVTKKKINRKATPCGGCILDTNPDNPS